MRILQMKDDVLSTIYSLISRLNRGCIKSRNALTLFLSHKWFKIIEIKYKMYRKCNIIKS